MKTVAELKLALAKASDEYIRHTGAETTRVALKSAVIRARNELTRAQMHEPLNPERGA